MHIIKKTLDIFVETRNKRILKVYIKSHDKPIKARGLIQSKNNHNLIMIL